MSTTSRAIKNTGFLYAKMGITIFFSLFTTRLILSNLGASDFGIFNIVGGAISMLVFFNTAMASSTQRFMSYSEGEGNKEKQIVIFNISIVLHFCIAVIMLFILVALGYFFFDGILNIDADRIYASKVIYGCLIISTIVSVMSVPYEALLNARENMLYYAIIGIIESLLKFAAAWSISKVNGDRLITYGILMSIIPILTLSIMRIYCHKHYEECKIAPRHYWDKSLMKNMTSFAGWNLLTSSTSIIYGYGAGIILNHFYGTLLNAANGISGQLNGQLMAFSSNMMKAVNPIIVKQEGGGDRETMYSTTFSACKISVFIYAIVAIPAFLESSMVLKIWLKNVPVFTEIFFQLLIIQMFIEQLTHPLGVAISAIGRIGKFNLVNSASFAIAPIMLYVLFKIGMPPQTLRILAIIVASFQALYKVLYSSTVGGMPFSKFVSDVVFRCLGVLFLSVIPVIILQMNLEPSITRFIFSTLIFNLIFFALFYHWGLTKTESSIVQETFKKLVVLKKC